MHENILHNLPIYLVENVMQIGFSYLFVCITEPVKWLMKQGVRGHAWASLIISEIKILLPSCEMTWMLKRCKSSKLGNPFLFAQPWGIKGKNVSFLPSLSPAAKSFRPLQGVYIARSLNNRTPYRWGTPVFQCQALMSQPTILQSCVTACTCADMPFRYSFMCHELIPGMYFAKKWLYRGC